MELRKVARTADVQEKEPYLVDVDGVSIGIYRSGDNYFAYENSCPHQGGPACEGGLYGDVKCEISPSGALIREYTSSEDWNIVCPWHGVEYDLRTGKCTSDLRLRLRIYEVQIENDEILVRF